MTHNEMKSSGWFFGLGRSHGRQRAQRGLRQQRQRRKMWQGFESLEQRRLLATLSFDTATNTLIYRDTLGEVNNVQYTFNDLGSTKEFTFTDTALIINSTGCGAPAGTTIICSTLPQTAAVRFELATNNDTLILNASRIGGGNAGAEDIAIGPHGAGQRVTGFAPGVPVDITGTEIIRFVGNGSDDSLTVNPGGGNDTVRIQNANPNTDVVQSSSLPNIEFTGLAAFQLNANAGAGNGADTITFETRDLEGATASHYTVATDSSDTLIIEGQGSNDSYTIDDPDGGGPQAARIVDGNGNGVQVTAVTPNLGLLQVDTLGGADTLNVNVTDLNATIQYNGGAGTTDSLNLTGSGITNETYTVGPGADEGTLQFDSASTITFTGLEPILDLVTATNLTVNGTGAVNAFAYTAIGSDGLVAVDAFETLRFNNKKNLILNGLAGNDSFAIGTANGLDADGGTITVDGGTGADSVEVAGSAAQDQIVVDQLGAAGARITGAQAVPITVATTEALNLNGLGGNDALTLHGTNTDDVATVTPGLPSDSGVFQVNSLLAVNYRGIGTGGTLTFAGDEGSNDRLVYVGTFLLDTFTVSATTGSVDLSNAFGSYPQLQQVAVEQLDIAAGGDSDQLTVHANQPYTGIRLDGGTGNDTVTLNGNSLDNALVTFGGGAPTVAGAGLGLVALPGIETLNLNNTNSGVIINGGGTTFDVTPTSTNTATVVVDAGAPQVQLEATSLTIDGQGGADDVLTVNGTAGSDQAVVTPGASTDAGSIAINERLPVDFLNLGAGGALVFAAGAGTDELVYVATQADDAFVVASTGDVTLLSPLGTHLVVRETDAEELLLNGLDGDDTFTVNPGHGYRNVTLSGGNPDAGSDSVTLNGDGTPITATLGISPATVTGGGLGAVALTGIETASINNLLGLVQVEGSSAADLFDVTPLDFDSARVQANGASPVVTVNTIGVLNINAAGGGEDVLQVHLTAASETVTVDGTQVAVIAGAALKPVNYNSASIDALKVFGYEGNDTFNVTQLAGTEIFIDGGDPIGVVGDRLNLTPAGTVTFEPGPEDDEGGFQVIGFAEVSFDHIEAVGVDISTGGGIVTVCGTGDDDQITAVGIAAGTVDVQVNDGPIIRYAGLTTLNLQGKNGDDDIDIDLIGNLGVLFNVDGGLPTTGGGDTLTVTGTDGADTATWSPSGPDSGLLLAVGTTINVSTTETVIYDGRDGGDALTVNGTPLDDNYAYSPAGVGTGSMTSDGGPAFSFLGVNDLRVTGGAGGFDLLAITTTEAADIVTSDSDTVFLIGGGAATLGAGLNRMELYTLGGNDVVDLDLQLAGVEKYIDAGDGNDLVDMSGALDATILGGDGNDLLIGSPLADSIYGGAGDDQLLGGAGADRLEGGTGNDTLQGDTGADQMFGGDDSDTLIWNNGDGSDLMEGGGGNDRLVVNADPNNGDTFVLRPQLNPPPTGTRVIFERTNLGLFSLNTDDVEQFELNGGGGNDSLTVSDLFETDARTVLFNAGIGNADSLTVDGRHADDTIHVNNTAGVLTVQGLSYDVTMVAANAVDGDTLTINGADGNDTIEAGPGTNLLALLTFNGDAGNDTLLGSAGNDSLNGGSGDDTFSGNGGTDTVDGGTQGDTILVRGTAGNDTVRMNLNGGGDLVVNTNGLVTTYVGTNLEQIRAEGGDQNDTAIIDVTNGFIPLPIHLEGGTGADSLSVVGVPAQAADEVIYSVGPTTPEGSLIYQNVGDATLMSITFTGLEPVIDLVPAATLTVNATNADNAINVDSSPANTVWGRVAVDAFETIEFANKTRLVINAGAGSDTIQLHDDATAPSGLAGITVNGGDPTAGSDTVIVSGTTGADTIGVSSFTSSGAVITGALPVPVTVATTEQLAIDGQGGGDDLTVTSPLFGSEIRVVPGATSDAGGITHFGSLANSTLLPLDYVGLGDFGSLTFDAAGGGRQSRLDVYGTNADDLFDVTPTANGQVQVFKPGFGVPVTVPIITTGVFHLRLIGLDGSDTFDVPGNHPITLGIEVQGGNPSGGSDVLNFTSAGATTLDLGNATIDDAAGIASPDVTYTGIEAINVSSAGQNLTVEATTSDDRVEVTPLGIDSGTLQANGLAPVVNFSATGTLTVDTLAGDDTLVVIGSSAANAISVNNSTAIPTVAVDARQVVSHANVEAVDVYALQGADRITVTQGAANNIPVFVDGGDPIGVAPGDVLVVTANTTLVHSAGPENDEGGIVADGLATISFDHIESIVVTDPGGNDLDVTVCGTGDDDQITAQGRAPNVVDVQVNDGPIITYNGIANLTLQGKNGDDDFDIDINVPNLGVTFTVDGGLPNASDILTVTGVDGDAPDTVTWVPGAADGGLLTVVGNPINVVATEHVIYDGESDGDTLQVSGSGTFTHTPGSAFDFGRMELRTANQTRLGIAYENLGPGAVAALGSGQNDILVAIGTAGADGIDVEALTGTVQLTTSVGARIPLQQFGIENLEVDALDDDDAIAINVPQPYQQVTVRGGSPGDSDVLTINDELGANDQFQVTPGFAPGEGSVNINSGDTLVPFAGIEHVLLLASNDTDSLILNDDLADNHWTVAAGPVFGDRVQIDNRESYDFSGFDTAELANNFGTDTFQVHPTQLVGSNSLLVTGGGGDALVAVGTPAGDLLTVAPGVGTQGTATVNGVAVDFNDIASVTLQGENGNDQFDVIASNQYQVFVDGGNPVGTVGDVLLLTANALAVFTPGPEGDAGGFEIDGLLPVTYDHIEGVAVLDPAGDDLVAIVMGTQGDDDITAVGVFAGEVDVTVNDGIVVRFAGVANLTLQGKNGDDEFDIDINVPNLGVTFTVDGGLPSTDPDIVTVTGVAGPLDLPVWTPTSEDDGTLVLAGQTVNIVDVERLIYDGENDADVLTVAGGAAGERFVHTPGTAVDGGSVSIDNGTSSLLGIDYVTLGLGGLVIIDGNGGSDTLAVRGTSGSDTVNVGFTARDEAVIDLRSSQGNHVDLASEAIENYEISTLDGDDNVNLLATIDMSGTFAVNAGGPGSGSDTLNLIGAPGIVESVEIRPAALASDDQEILGLSSPNPIVSSGIELITYEGVNDLDTLSVNPGNGDNTVRVERGSGADLVTSDSLPDIAFRNVSTFELDADASAGQSGADVVTFVTRSLSGAIPANYQLVAGATDTLVIEGVDGAADDYTLTNPTGQPSVRVRDNAAAPDVLVTETSGNLGRLQINTLGGDDRVLVDVNLGSGSDLIAVPITFDGGGNSDLLTISGTPATVVLNAEYRPGPAVTEGRLTYNTTGMIIDFNNLEPVIDLVPAVNFIVNGTNAANAIAYDDNGALGQVTVDDYESIQFANKVVLILNGNDGDDAITLNSAVHPAGLAQINVNGGNSNGGDTLLVANNNPGVAIDVTALTNDGATITGAQWVPVTADTVERIAIDGAASGNLLNLNTPVGGNTITYTPGATVDSGDIRVDSFVPLHFENLGAGTLSFTNTGGGRLDTLVHRGSDVNDQFTVDDGVGAGRVLLANSPGTHVPVVTPGIAVLTVEGLDGDDTFTVDGDHPFDQVNAHGGNPDDGDTLAVVDPSGAPTVDLGNATVTGYGGPITYTGLQTISANAGGVALQLLTSSGDDDVTVTPLTSTSGVAQANGDDPIVNYSNTGAVSGSTLRVNTLGGQDTLIINATALADRVVVNGPGQSVDTGASGGTVDFVNANLESLTVNGLEGDDIFDVTPVLTLSIFIDGGDPIGIEGDTLILQADNTSIFHGGPENDEGGFEIDGTPITSYDHIERIVVNDPGTGGNANDLVAVVCGTHGDDDITAQGIATNVVDVTVNDGPTVRYDGVAQLTLEGKNGDDDIDIDLQVETLNVEFTADGGLPSVTGDTVTVTGVNNDTADNVNWTPDPSSTENGTLTVNGETINVVNTESLLYDGEGDHDNLSATGGGRFVHTPGSTVDAGRMALGSLLAIDYVNLGAGGTVTADGTSGGDTLVALGTGGSDTVDITLTNDDDIDIDLSSTAGMHVDLRSNNVESYEVRSLTGDDRINLNATFNVSGTFRVYAGDPGSGSDSFSFTDPGASSVGITPDVGASDNQVISGVFTTALLLSGVELVHYDGNAADTLTVNPGAGDNSVTVRRGTNLGTDQVTSDSLPRIEFEGVNTFLVDASAAGSDTVTFVTWFLTGAINTNYQMSGSAVDTLVIQGSDGAGAGNDSYTLTNPAGAAPVAVRDNNGTQVTVTAINAAQGRLQLNTLGGDDSVTIDVGGTNVIPTPITFDGGGGSDLLRLQGNPLSPTDAVYSPGAAVTEGRLQYSEASVPPATMTVDFLNLEPVIDLVNGTLTVNGTDANNAIDYRRGNSNRGLVSVDGFELIEFANKTGLTLSGGAGDDKFNLNNQGTAPAGLTSITVLGGNSTTGDELVVNGTSVADNIGFTPTSPESARVTGVQSVAFVDAFTIESVVINGLGDVNATNGDVLMVNTPDGTPANPINSSVELTPGATLDSGSVQVDTLVPMRFVNLSSIGSVRVVDLDAFDQDRLVYNGTESSDAFIVPDPRVAAGTPSIAKVRFFGSIPFLQVPVSSDMVENYTLRGRSGNDTFDVTPLVGVNVRVEGDDPAAGSDTLNLNAAATDVNLNLETSTVTQAGFGNVVYNGIEALNIDANGQDLNTVATSVDDVVEVTPLGANSGTLQANNASPLVNFRETADFNLDTAGGQNTVIVNGTSAGEIIAVDGDSVTVGTRETVNYTSTGGGNALTVNGLEGSDTFNVTPSASVPIFIDGGDPIGITGDRLNVIADDVVLYDAGPENDEGGIEADGDQVVSFDHIEAVTITDGGMGPGEPDLEVTICATNGDDDITAQGVATNVVNVTVNDGPIITLNGVANLILEGKNGDDDIDIDIQVPNLGVEITADGGLPSTSGDEVTVTGVANPLSPDAATWEPLDVDAGTLTVSHMGNPVTINIVNTETLTYDGESQDETLTVIGDGSLPMFNNEQERFVHTPGKAADAGRIDISTVDTNPISSNDTLLGINYVSLGLDGAITIDGNGSAVPQGDMLVLLGTSGDDVMRVDFTATNAAAFDLSHALGPHVTVFSVEVENYELRTLEGDDQILLQAAIQASGFFSIHAGGPGNGDLLAITGDPNTTELVRIAPAPASSLDQLISGLSPNPISVSGVELIRYDGVDDEDTLTVDPGSGDNQVFVDRGNGVDLVTSDSLPPIEFDNLATFVVDAATGGADRVTFATWNLGGAINTNYQMTGSGIDTLIVEGVDAGRNGNDSFTVTNPAGTPSVAVTDNNGRNVTVTETSGNLGRLQLNTLGGDDRLLVDVGSTDLVNVPITFDGGGNSDLLTVSGTPATTVTNVVYSPGASVTEGRLTYDSAMIIDFLNLEPIIDLVPAANLTVNGTNASNAIDYRQGSVAGRGLVSVDGFEVIEFSLKDQLTLNGNAGDDTINLDNPVLPTGNTLALLDRIIVNGGGSTTADKVIVNGTAAADSLTYLPLTPDSANITGAQAVTRVSVNTAERVVINSLAANDRLDVVTPAGANTTTYTPGATVDAGGVRVDSLLPMDFVNLGAGGVLAFNDASGTRVDTLVHRGSDVDDQFDVAATTGYVLLTNSPGTHVPVETDGVLNLTLNGLGGDDTFNVDGLHPYLLLAVQGQQPSPGDVLNVTGTTGTENITVNLEPATITGLGSRVGERISFTGVELVNIDGGGGTGDSDTLTVVGTQDDDILTYEPLEAEDGKFHNAGSSTNFVFRNIGDDFTVDGGQDGADKLILVGTNDHDVIVIDTPNRVASVEDTFGVVLKPVNLATSVEDLDALGRDGDDTFLVVPAPPLSSSVDGIPRNLLIDVDGGAPSASDALVIARADGSPLARTDFVVVSHSRRFDEGVIRVYRDATGVVGDQVVNALITPPIRFPDIGYTNVEIVDAKVHDARENRLILGPDLYEQNEDISDAKFIGSGQTLNVQELAIFPPRGEHRFVDVDEDWFRFVATDTGTLDFQVYFHEFNPELLPQGGNLHIEVYDVDGDLIAGNGPNFGTNDQNQGLNPLFVRHDNERIRIPAVAGQTYYLRVFGPDDPTVDPMLASRVVNGYDMTVINTPPTVPYDLELADIIGEGKVAMNAGTSTTKVFADPTMAQSLVQEDDFYNGKYLYFIDGNQASRRALITDYEFNVHPMLGVMYEFTLGAGVLSAAPATGDSFVVETHDTGRSQLDDVTRDDTPVIRFRLDDGIFLSDLPGNSGPDSPPDEVIPIPFNTDQARTTTTAGYRVPVFIEGPPQSVSGPLPQVPVGYARMLAQGVYEFDFGMDAIDLVADPTGNTLGAFSLEANNGSYFISAKVEMDDPADPTQFGFGDRSVSLEIVVDTQPPLLYFGDPQVADDGLVAGSDSGVDGYSATFTDEVTNVTNPWFWGTAEANALIQLFVDRNGNGVVDGADVRIAETVAIPLDGTNQFPSGQWKVQSNVDLNDPQYFSTDGVRRILATAEDVAGNVTQVASLDIFIDTAGPIVTNVYVTTVPNYDLFDPKPSTDGPTPPVTSLTIAVRDLPARSNLDPDFLYPALLEAVIETPGNVRLVGDHSGVIAIQTIDFISNPIVNGQPASGRIVLTFAEPLPDDRFTLTVFDNVVDPVGNRLDGETDTIEPEDDPRFPSGDGQPGGDFIARFTVDSRPEIATACCGSIYVDANGNFVFDPEGQDNDATNRDLVFSFALSSDAIFAGNFAPAGAASASGFDKLGAYGYTGGQYRFLLDFDHDGVVDFSSVSQWQVNGIPVAGDFDPTHPGDEIGLFDGTRWYLDTNGNNILETTDLVINSTIQGLPIVGDFDGNGTDDLGTFAAGSNTFFLDLNRDGVADRTVNFGFTGIHERPVTGDLNLDGVDDLGLWVPGRQGQIPREAAEWYFLISDSPTGQFDPFSPAPLGNDLFAQFGDDLALPVFGNFDPPPAVPDGDEDPDPVSLTNPDNPYDTNMDGGVSPVDVLVVINWINSPPAHPSGLTRPDVSADKIVAPGDALMVINYLNVQGAGEGEASVLSAAAGLASGTPVVRVVADGGDLVSPSGRSLRVQATAQVNLTLPVDVATRTSEMLGQPLRRETVQPMSESAATLVSSQRFVSTDSLFAAPQGLGETVRDARGRIEMDEESDALLDLLADDVARIWDRDPKSDN